MNSLHYSPTASASNPLHTHLSNSPTPSPSPSAATVPLKRTRAKRSCDFCRKRKSRCDADASVPCSNCKAWGYTCEFQTVRKKRGPPSVYVDNLEKRCKKMERLLISLTNSTIKELESHDFKHNVRAAATSPPAPSDSSSDDDEDDDDDFDPTADIQQRLTNLDIKDYDSIKYTGHSAGLQLVDHDVFKTKPYIRWPGRDNVVLQMMGQDELMIVHTGKPDTRLDVGLSMRSTIFDSDQPRSHPPASPTASKRPTKQLADKMIGLYFTHLHPFLPIVNKARFLEQYCASHAPQILVQAVLALSFRFSAQHFNETHANDYSDLYFRKVMKRLRDSLRSRLCHVQAALLMTLYLDMDDGDVESVQWFTLGSAIRMAQDLGLHRSCVHWKLPPSEIETRHRVFYACYVLDRWMAARAGKPLTILDRDFDTAMPSVYEVTDASSPETTGEPVYRHFALLIKLSEILGRVLKALYMPKAKHSNSNAGLDDPTIRVVFDRRLKNWKASLDDENAPIPPTQKGHLLVFYYTIVLLLHRPFVQLSAAQFPDLQSIVADSREACTEAANAISTVLRSHSSLATAETSHMSLCLPTCFVYAMFQSSLVHLSNAIQDRASQQKMQCLQQSLSLLKSHKHLCPAPRAIEILQMLITINNLECSHDSIATPPQLPPPLPSHTPIPSAKLPPSTDEEYPKSNHLFERMLNCSVVGGITPDIRPDVESAISQQPSNCFLPQPETSQLSMNYHYHHHHHQQQPLRPHDYSFPLTLATPHAPLPPPPLQHQPYVMAHQPLAFIPPHPPSHHQPFTTAPTTSAAGWHEWNVYIEHQNPVIDNTSGLHIPPQS